MLGKSLLGMILALVLLGVVRADQVVLNGDHPGVYTVVEGDTLWDISGRFLKHPWQWPEVWEANPQIENPHLIYPGDQIQLTYVDGRPRLGVQRSREIKLSPSVRASAHDRSIPPIPLDAIQQFLTRPRVVSPGELATFAYVVGSQDQHLVNGQGARIYVRGLPDESTTRYSLFRPGGEYKDPDTGEVLGHEALHIADAVVARFGDPATATITWSNREVIKGDRLMAQEVEEYTSFVPRAPAGQVDGSIIAVVDGVTQIGQLNVIVINRGKADGMEPGHVLAIFQAGERITDRLAAEPGTVQMPEERAGELVVFRTFERVSYALVMNTQRPVHVHDRVRNP